MTYAASELPGAFSPLLKDLGGALDALAVPWMLIGGLAVGAWTEPRGTKDCDLAVALPTSTDALADALGRLGFVVLRGDLSRAQDGGAVRLRLERAPLPPMVLDLLCAGTEFEREALAAR